MAIKAFDRLSQYRYNMDMLKKSILNRDRSFAAIRKDMQSVQASGKLMEQKGTEEYRKLLRKQLTRKRQLRTFMEFGLFFLILLTAGIIFTVVDKDNKRHLEMLQKATIENSIARNAEYYRFMELGNQHLAKDEWYQAVGAYREASRLCMGCPEALEKISVSHVLICNRTGLKCNEALRYINDLLQSEPDNYLILGLRAEIHMAMYQKHLAEADWHKADSIEALNKHGGD